MVKKPNLVPYIDKLSVKQRAIVMRCVNLAKERNGEQGWVHQGILPFVTMDEAIGAIKGQMDTDYDGRFHHIYATILAILGDRFHKTLDMTFYMYLDAKKVYRLFGKRPDLGKPLNWLPKERVTVGFTNRFGKMKPDKDVWVAPVIVVKKLKSIYEDHYAVTVEARYVEAVKEWLHANCTSTHS